MVLKMGRFGNIFRDFFIKHQRSKYNRAPKHFFKGTYFFFWYMFSLPVYIKYLKKYANLQTDHKWNPKTINKQNTIWNDGVIIIGIWYRKHELEKTRKSKLAF